jgi:alkylation response protein AidB-like acyl-CoA dehydrogenase
MTQFLIDTSQQGWSVARVNDMMGNEITPNVQMRFEDYRVHKSMMISGLNQGFMPLRSHLASKNIHFMASLGDTIRVWEEIRDYAKTRVQGGKPIIQHANVGMLVAEGDCILRNARLQQYQFAWECDMEKPETRVDPLIFYYINYYYKHAIERIVHIGNEVYGGLAPQKELYFQHWVRLNLSILHGGSTGDLSLIKAAHML